MLSLIKLSGINFVYCVLITIVPSDGSVVISWEGKKTASKETKAIVNHQLLDTKRDSTALPAS